MFAHSWHSDENGKIIRIYNTVKYIFEKPKFGDEHDKKYHYTDDVNTWPPRNALSAYYSIYTANQLKCQYENEMGFKYDWVIRSRYDYALNTIIPFNKLNNKRLYAPDRFFNGQKTQLMCDQFAFSNSEFMDKYSETYLHIDEFYSNGTWMIGEHLLGCNMHKQCLVDRLTYFEMNRPFSERDPSSSGLIRTDHKKWKRLSNTLDN